MKKALSVMIVCIMLVGAVLSVTAAGCKHSYTAEDFAADCRNNARTVYTLSLIHIYGQRGCAENVRRRQMRDQYRNGKYQIQNRLKA